jgi:flavin reductase (DIM6/NTAB) family NADH-FMN oxidoreductase RutF
MKTSIGAKPLAFTTPVWCIGTYDAAGKPNVMTASWGGICSSRPPCVNFSLRKATYTYQSVLQSQAFTVSIPSEQYAKQADYFGMASGKNVDKFAATGLTAARSEVVNAPYVAEFPLIIECRLIHHHEIDLHTIFIGQIMDIKADPDILDADHLPDIEKLRPMTYCPESMKYYGIGAFIGMAFNIGREVAKRR